MHRLYLAARPIRALVAWALIVLALTSDGGRRGPPGGYWMPTARPPIPVGDVVGAEAALARGEVRSAFNAFAMMLSQDPTRRTAAVGLVESARELGALDAAHYVLDALERIAPTRVVRLAQAELGFRAGDTALALSILLPVLRAGTIAEAAELSLLAHIAVVRGDGPMLVRVLGGLASTTRRPGGVTLADRRNWFHRRARVLGALDPATARLLALDGLVGAKRADDSLQFGRSLLVLAALSQARSAPERAAALARAAVRPLWEHGAGADLYVALAQVTDAEPRPPVPEYRGRCGLVPRRSRQLLVDCQIARLEALWRSGRIVDAMDGYSALRASPELGRSPMLMLSLSRAAAPMLRLVGRWADARALLVDGRDAAASLRREDLEAEHLAELAALYRTAGRWQQAQEQLDQIDHAEALPSRSRLRVEVERARLAAARGDPEEARAAADVALGVARDLGPDERTVPLLELGRSQRPSDSVFLAEDTRSLLGGRLAAVVGAALRGSALEQQGDSTAALDAYGTAQDELGRWLSETGQIAVRLALADAWRELGGRRAALATALGDAGLALESMEATRSYGRRPAGWEHVAGHLEEDQALIAFADVQGALVAWVVRSGQIRQLHLASGVERVRGLTDLWLRAVSGRSPSPSWKRLGAELAGATLSDVTRQIDLGGISTLVIVPDHDLGAIPFDALNDPARPGAFLGDRFTVVLAPSLALLDATWHTASRERNAVAFLPQGGVEAAQEGLSLARRFSNTEIYAKGRATEEAFISRAAVSGVIHFGGHAVAPSGLLTDGGLTFAPSRRLDGVLSYIEISTLPLDGAVVVLLGCDTARRSDSAYGMLTGLPTSLSEAFLAAGSRSVVGSLWSLSDGDALAMARAFYGADGPTGGARSLGVAKRLLRGLYPNRPGLWAAAVWQGAP